MSVITVQPSGIGKDLLQAAINNANPHDTIVLRGGNYTESKTVEVTKPLMIIPYENEPAQLISGASPAWLHIQPNAIGTVMHGLTLGRDGDISKAKQYDDFAIISEANNVRLENLRVYGQTKGIHIKGSCKFPTVIYCDIGPMYQSCIVLSTSYSTVRGGLIAYNHLHHSWREDGIQFMPDYGAVNTATDISNLGMTIYQNQIDYNNENGIDLKGAGQIVIDSNIFRFIAGSNDGLLNGWNHIANGTISRGAKTVAGPVLMRNNDCQQCCSGFHLEDSWIAVHNLIADNNYDAAGGTWAGYGLMRRGAGSATAKNNLIRGHGIDDIRLLSGKLIEDGNAQAIGKGVPLAKVTKDGSGVTLPLDNAGYFTDWFGRKDIDPDVLYLNGTRYEVQAVDWQKNTVTLNQETSWKAGDLVTWRSPNPVVGIQDNYVVPIDPPVDPPVEPTQELVQLMLEASFNPTEAAQLRTLLKDRAVRIRLV